MIQNRAAKLVAGASKFDHVSPIFKEFHWLTVDKRVIYKIELLMFKVMRYLAPNYLMDRCIPRSSSSIAKWWIKFIWKLVHEIFLFLDLSCGIVFLTTWDNQGCFLWCSKNYWRPICSSRKILEFISIYSSWKERFWNFT